MKTSNIYLDLFVVFAPLSLISVGGGQSVVGDMHLQAVDIYHWLTHAQFIDLFAISRAAPGPGALLATLIGWQVSGWQGALVASLALFGPSTILAYFVTRAWHKSHDRPWTAIVQNALAPLASGLLLTSAMIILRSTSGGVTPWLIAAASAGIFWRFKTVNPLPVLCVGGLVLVLARLWF
jgi:chromate transporter